ncbi:NAD(P)H-binding protein [Corynebacterium sp. c8Ua_181]|uniref:NAD(P)H-binding protein n=1 Tax=Corynebacterium curieae TaxID=2913500 RepID=A0A9X3M8M3_9CORY|nr:NAD(P)H-binding protein [Corynebacterium curieae]MCZ9305979.1 NAD(P)H-binding protein [Corynebacterium curieae]MDV2423519.1 NAD(P)H-binding protein [Corynebacterium curieae]
MTDKKKILYIGGHGKVGLLTAPKLVEAGHEVHSLIRNPEQKADIEKLGATPVVADITEQSAEQWAELFADYDAVVWGAGNGGRGGADLTWAVDRDGALATLDAMEKLEQEGKKLPSYLMISYVGSQEATTDPADEKWYAYVESKKEVDNRLVKADYPHLILKPAMLTEERAQGLELIEDKMLQESMTSSRELVADVIVEALGRDSLPESPIAFVDGKDPVSSIK